MQYFKAYWAILIILGIAFSTSCEINPLQKGNLAPDFKMPDLEKNIRQLSSYRGKIVMLHFWTDWCNACRKEFPLIQDLYVKIKQKKPNFELLAINVGQDERVSKQFQTDFEITFPMLIDKRAISKELYQVKAFPTNYFINAEGRIIRKIVGWVTQKQVEVIVEQNSKE